MPVSGPFGPGAVPDLGALKAASQGQVPLPVAFIERLDMLIAEVAGIRFAMQPKEASAHHASVMPVVDADGKPQGYGVFCVGCSDAAGAYINPCKLLSPEALIDWPSPLLISHPDYAQLIPDEASPDVPDFPPES